MLVRRLNRDRDGDERRAWHHVSVKHLERYVNEATFRLNEGNVKIHTLNRLASFLARALKHRITYWQLTA